MSELKEVKAIEQEIEALQAKKKALLAEQRKQALNSVKDTIRSFGFSASELGLVSAAKKATVTRARPPKYENPADATQTWGGGAQPKWAREHLARGGKLTDLLIKR